MSGNRLPGYIDYLNSLRNPASFLKDPYLKQGQLVLTKRGRPLTYSGNFALTAAFEVQGVRWALRCFLNKMPDDLEMRYREISRFVQAYDTDVLVNIQYQSQGILVDGTWYAMCKMEWVEGATLNLYIKTHRGNGTSNITTLPERFVKLVSDLQALECAHGDLQHGNIIADGHRLRLVDYDGMFVPAFKGKGIQASEIGHRHYQHPARRSQGFFDDTLDRFSAISIFLSLAVLANDSSLFDDEDEAIYLTDHDYLDPQHSERLDTIASMGFRDAATAFRKICGGDIRGVPTLPEFLLLDDNLLAELPDPLQKWVREGAHLEKPQPVKLRPSAVPPPPIMPPPPPVGAPFAPGTGQRSGSGAGTGSASSAPFAPGSAGPFGPIESDPAARTGSRPASSATSSSAPPASGTTRTPFAPSGQQQPFGPIVDPFATPSASSGSQPASTGTGSTSGVTGSSSRSASARSTTSSTPASQPTPTPASTGRLRRRLRIAVLAFIILGAVGLGTVIGPDALWEAASTLLEGDENPAEPTPDSESRPVGGLTGSSGDASGLVLEAPDDISGGTPDQATWQPVTRRVDSVLMAFVPAGCFAMGSDNGDPDEAPVHSVCLDPYWIDVYEVTNAAFGSSGAFAHSGAPRETVSWYQAKSHCEARGGRLPTEAEWEYAARGPDALVYPWGNEFDRERFVWLANSNRQTTTVGTRPDGASWVGAQDMLGNVAEWTSSFYRDYPYTADAESRTMNPTSSWRSVRGGSFSTYHLIRAADRDRLEPTANLETVGFRCVIDADSSSPRD